MLVLTLCAFCFNSCSGTEKKEGEGQAPSQQPTVTPGEVANTDTLIFPDTDYTEVTETIEIGDGTKQVTYRYYKDICYVANPVDTKYQSMNVKVPIRIDGKDINADKAPILFINSVGGYLSASNSVNDENKNNFTQDIMSKEDNKGTVQNTTDGTNQKRANADELNVNGNYALATGYVVVEPGCRGRDNVDEQGNYYGKAPAAIVDLKAAVRYIRHNDARMPGDANYIISSGVSAGGALSALLAASGDSELYDAYLDEIGAADESDKIYAAACYCPITDLEHADMAYEWMFGSVDYNGKAVDSKISGTLSDAFSEYQTSLNYTGRNNFGAITADNYDVYILDTYLIPAATTYLSDMTKEERDAYLAERPWITWKDGKAKFTFEDYVTYIGRQKNAPAFDSFDLSSGENSLFGDKTTDAKHFTDVGIQNSTADKGNSEIDEELQTIVNMMNPMYFINENNAGCAKYWWIRYGTKDTNTSLPIIVNLDLGLNKIGKTVDTTMYWDAGHGANQDPAAFIRWIGDITGYK